jgi:hypothetical protein
MDHLLDLWIKQFQSVLDAMWASLDFWRITALALLTLAVAVVTFRRQLLAILIPRSASVHDKDLFKKFLDALPSTGNVAFVRDYDFANSFRLDDLRELTTFTYRWNNPEHEFLDQELEVRRQQVLRAIQAFLRSVDLYTSPNHAERQSVFPRGVNPEFDVPPAIRREIDELNEQSRSVYAEHSELVRLAKTKLLA